MFCPLTQERLRVKSKRKMQGEVECTIVCRGILYDALLVYNCRGILYDALVEFMIGHHKGCPCKNYAHCYS